MLDDAPTTSAGGGDGMLEGDGVVLVRWTDVRWRSFLIPDSSPPVQLGHLWTGSDGATVVLVEFPPAWERSVGGHYAAGEEALFLSGMLAMNDLELAEGMYAWFPPGLYRGPSASPLGALALARFDGAYRWAPGRSVGRTASPLVRRWSNDPATDSPRTGTGRLLHRSPGATTWVVDDSSAVSAAAPLEVFSVTDRMWAYVPANAAMPHMQGPLICRAKEIRP